MEFSIKFKFFYGKFPTKRFLLQLIQKFISIADFSVNLFMVKRVCEVLRDNSYPQHNTSKAVTDVITAINDTDHSVKNGAVASKKKRDILV